MGDGQRAKGDAPRWMVREYRTLAVPFTNAERSAMRLDEGALFRVASVAGLPYAPDVDGCLVTFEPVADLAQSASPLPGVVDGEGA